MVQEAPAAIRAIISRAASIVSSFVRAFVSFIVFRFDVVKKLFKH